MLSSKPDAYFRVSVSDSTTWDYGDEEDAYLLPEQSFPGWEGRCLEQSVLKNGLHTTEGLNDISTVSVEVP